MASGSPEALIKGRSLVIYDLDGTLFDLDVDWQGLKKELVDIVTLAIPEFEFGGLIDLYERTAERPSLKTQCAQVQVRFEADRLAASRPVAGGMASLKWRLGRGLACSIFSSNTRRTIEHLMKGLPVSPIVSLESVRRQKPDPEGILMILDKLKVPPGSALMIGNSDKDEEAAARAEISFINVKDVDEAWFG